MKKQVNFSLGENFGRMLQDLAREKLICEYDGNKAVSIITDSLIGCPENIALDIIFGTRKIEVVGGSDVDVVNCPKDDFDIEYIIERKLLDLNNQASSWEQALRGFETYNKRHLGMVTMAVPTSVIFNMCFEKAFNNQYFLDTVSQYVEELDDDEWGLDIVDDIQKCCHYINELFEEVRKVTDLAKWVHSKRPEAISEGLSVVPKQVIFLKTQIESLCVRVSCSKEQTYKKYQENTESNLSPAKHELHVPVDITDKYDAGWLSPDGLFYGDNGELFELLHLRIAEAILENGLITIPDGCHTLYDRNPDAFLAANGWCRIHYNNVLFEGYMCGSPGIVHLTEAQKEQLAKYGRKCYDGQLTFGPSRKYRTVSQFGATEDPMMYKLFDYE